MAVVQEHRSSSRIGPVNPAAAYDAVAEQYDGVYQRPIDAAEDGFVRELMRGRAPMRVLDIGCGTGLGLRLCNEIWYSGFYEGVDPSSKMLDIARRRPIAGWHTEYRQMTAEEYCREITIPTRPDLILMLYCSPYIGGFAKVVRALAEMGAERCRMVIACPAPARFESGRYGMLRMNVDGTRPMSYRADDLEYITEFVGRSRPVLTRSIGSYSGWLARRVARLLPCEAAIARGTGLIVRPDFSYAVLELGR